MILRLAFQIKPVSNGYIFLKYFSSKQVNDPTWFFRKEQDLRTLKSKRPRTISELKRLKQFATDYVEKPHKSLNE